MAPVDPIDRVRIRVPEQIPDGADSQSHGVLPDAVTWKYANPVPFGPRASRQSSDQRLPSPEAGRDQAARLVPPRPRDRRSWSPSPPTHSAPAKPSRRSSRTQAPTSHGTTAPSMTRGEEEIIELACTHRASRSDRWTRTLSSLCRIHPPKRTEAAHRHRPRPLLLRVRADLAPGTRHAGLLHPAHPDRRMCLVSGHGPSPSCDGVYVCPMSATGT